METGPVVVFTGTSAKPFVAGNEVIWIKQHTEQNLLLKAQLLDVSTQPGPCWEPLPLPVLLAKWSSGNVPLIKV